ncbi:hypothetical protein [Sphingobacterium griseoflavum]|uniref:Prealbumin-like fold domain-containing protein n=1 Tax=Sphingobacterium griseoflavum TaxID=1474952 RepID=A0ABQ3HUR1_9SPHI|nr:hypothetical protein [Sphingobacterium griseoflavum]GHE36704.1 hypothetical protein GCM10017764_19840 [Sphingobacterium griseoflavum]
MKSTLGLLTLIIGLLTACEKTTNVDVLLSTSGKLNYKLIDDSGKGVPNVKVSLYDMIGSYSNQNVLIDQRTTDAAGVADFGDLNPKTYLLRADSVGVNNVGYMVQEYLQVITGETRQRETKVTDFSGTLTVTVQAYNNQRLRNVGVAVIPANRWYYSANTTYALRVADVKGVTDESGQAVLKIPSDKEYVLCLYNSSTNATYNAYNYIRVQKGQKADQTVLIY